MSTESTKPVVIEGNVQLDDRGAVHKKAIADIVGMIVAKYETEAERSFSIGKRAFEHAQWQKSNFPGYKGTDFDQLMKDIRQDVRLYVAIKPESIRVDDWVRCHVLRELVRESLPDGVAESFSLYEYLILCSKALTFDKKSVEGSLVEGWADLMIGVHQDRLTERVSADEFQERVDANVKRLAAAKVVADPVKSAAEAAAKSINKKAEDFAKATTAVTTAVSHAIAKGDLDAGNIMGIVEAVAKDLKKPLPSQFGFDPASCTKEDCKVLASAMFAAGKYNEMKFLADRLGKMVAAMDKAREQAQSTLPIESDKVKAAREQRKAESRRNKASAPAPAMAEAV